jgi:hypothetical protein
MASSRLQVASPFSWPSQLLIAIPCAELGYSRFWQQLLATKDFGWHVAHGRVMTVSGSYIHDSHTQLVREALTTHGKRRWDRLLFLEHDHEFEPDTLEKHGHYKEPVVSALYVKRDMREPLPVVFQWDADRHNALAPKPIEMKRMLDNPGLHKVDVVPLGCTSIRRDVLERWPQETPRFMSPINPDTNATMSDDVWFCRKAQDQGYEIFLDTSSPIGHYVLQRIDIKYFIAWWNSRPEQTTVEEVTVTEEDGVIVEEVEQVAS